MFQLWLIFMLATTGYDLLKRRVPNWLVLSGLAFAALALSTGQQPFDQTWASALTASFVAFSVFLVFYAMKVMGAGDVKFAGVLALWVGLIPFAAIWLMASILAALHALLFIASRRQPFPNFLLKVIHGPAINDSSKSAKSKHIPYAAYLALSAITWLILFKRPPGT